MSATAQDFKSLFEAQFASLNLVEGALTEGRVTNILRDFIVVNIGFKSEGFIPVEEFRNLDGDITIAVGDTLKVVIEEVEDDQGRIILSKERADARAAWDNVENIFETGGSIDGMVVGKVKGGLAVNLGGVRAFLPGSQIDIKPVKSLDRLMGQKYSFKIIKLNKMKGNIVLSRRAVLEVERESLRKDILENIKEGMIVRGAVKNMTDYGAFVDLGGIDGLLHVTDLSWGRVQHPSEVIKVGDEMDVVVLKYDPANHKVSLGLKQLSEDPWAKAMGKFSTGDKIKGRVVSVADYGVFVEIEPGIEGLVHISELSWTKKVRHPSKIVKVGDMVEAVILDQDVANKKIALGLKQLEANPWDMLHQKFPVGSKINGTIRNMTDFGIFVGIGDEPIDGLVHVSDISWDREYKWPNEDYKKGQDILAVVLNIDRDNQKFSLGIKQISDDPFAVLMRQYPLGTMVKGIVDTVGEKIITIKLEDNSIALLPISETGVSRTELKTQYRPGEALEAMVKKFDDRERKMVLSVKMLSKNQEKQNMRDFLDKQGEGSVTLKDIMKS